MKVFILGIFKETGHHSRGASPTPLLALELLDFSCQFTTHGDRGAVASPSGQQGGWLSLTPDLTCPVAPPIIGMGGSEAASWNPSRVAGGFGGSPSSN